MNRTALTQRQMQILEVIRQGVHERGFPPSIREIGARVGLASSSTVHNQLRQLEQKGFIRRDPARSRSIALLTDPIGGTALSDAAVEVESDAEWMPGMALVPLLESVDLAGKGREPVRVPLPRDLVGGDDGFLFQVEGDSMRDASILHGDLVIARRGEEAEDGDIVVALVNKEITVKRVFRGNGFTRLEADNRRMKPIFVRDARILGKVVGLIRRIY